MPPQLHHLPGSAWWVIAVAAGLAVLRGGKGRNRKDGSGVILLLIAGGVLLAAGGSGALSSVKHHSSKAFRGSGTLGCPGLERLWESAGGSPGAAHLAAQVAMAESSGRQYAAYRNTDGSVDEGYWQINNRYWPRLATYDPMGNARAAVSISRNGTNWSPWVTYQNGAQVGYC